VTRDFRKLPFLLLDTQFAALKFRIESQVGRFVNIGVSNDMDTFDKRISPQVIHEIQLSACRYRKLQFRFAGGVRVWSENFKRARIA
jgi:hypothetical protein